MKRNILLFGGLIGLIALSFQRPTQRETGMSDRHAEPAARRIPRETSPRRPAPEAVEYDIDLRGPTVSSQGTAFVVNQRGSWLTAAHNTRGCLNILLVDDDGKSRATSHVLEAQGRDVTLILDGFHAPQAFSMSQETPPPESIAYHMGFPGGHPAVVQSRLLGAAGARDVNGSLQQMLVWAETWRSDGADADLEGISGAPVIAPDGRVVGIFSAVSQRRGRLLSVSPQSLRSIASMAHGGNDIAAPAAIEGPASAVAQFRQWLARGMIRQVHCDK